MILKDKVALITGSGRGLGRAIAVAMSTEGAEVTIFSRSLSELESVSSQIESRGGTSLTVAGDISNEDDVSRMVSETIRHYSGIDILVNNAAVIGPARFLQDTGVARWEQTINTNLKGAFLAVRSVLPHMIARGGGKIINIASGLGQMPFPRFCAYSVSKAGLIQLTRSLSEELKEMNIQVNAIDPGLMDTTMQRDIRKLDPSEIGEELYKSFLDFRISGSLKDPAEVAELAVFLASASADRINGVFGTLSS